MQAEDPQLMKIAEVMAMLKVSKTTYYVLRKAGKFGPILKVGKRARRHRRSHVVAYVKSLDTTS